MEVAPYPADHVLRIILRQWQFECEDATSPGEGEGVALAVPGDLTVVEGVGLVAERAELADKGVGLALKRVGLIVERAELADKGMATGDGRFPWLLICSIS